MSIIFPRRRAFTLIELLIVVAIIAILAAIAVPNFMEAHTRSRVSRCLADMRTLTTALEAYCVDWNHYPPYGCITPEDDLDYPARQNNIFDKMAFPGPGLTTPLAYISNFLPDPFAAAWPGRPILRTIEYLNLDQHVENFASPPPPFAAFLLGAWGSWRTVAAGPDLDRGWDIKNNIVYDPTNGTVSDGDIVRCRKDPENRLNRQAP